MQLFEFFQLFLTKTSYSNLSKEKIYNHIQNGTKEMCLGENDCGLNSVCNYEEKICVCNKGFQTSFLKTQNCGKKIIIV
jgi:hypothetical protein